MRWKTPACRAVQSDRVKLNAFEENYNFSKDSICVKIGTMLRDQWKKFLALAKYVLTA